MLSYNNFNILYVYLYLYICIFKCYKWISVKSFLFLRRVMLIHTILFNRGIIFPLRNISRSIYPFSDGWIFRLFAIFCFSSSAMSLAMTLWHLLVCVPGLSGVDRRSAPSSPKSHSETWTYSEALPSTWGQVSFQYSQSPALCTDAGAHPCLLSPLWSLSTLLEAEGQPAPDPHYLAPPAPDPRYLVPPALDPPPAGPSEPPCRGSGPPPQSWAGPSSRGSRGHACNVAAASMELDF